MSNITWYFKQLLPLQYVTTYGEDGKRWVEVWRMWLGRCFARRRWELAK